MHSRIDMRQARQIRGYAALMLLSIVVIVIPAEAQIEIDSIEELQRIGSDSDYPSDGHYMLTTNIDASGTEFWNDGAGFEPIGRYGLEDRDVDYAPFTGLFDGRGFMISGLVINRPDESEVGLFGATDERARIENLLVEDSLIVGGDFTGGLVGVHAYSAISHCSFSGDVFGNTIAGGLVGINAGSITACYTMGAVEGVQFIGGLSGTNAYGMITHCYSTAQAEGLGDVGGLVGGNAGSIMMSYATGNVAGNTRVGGLVGFHELGAVTQCYSTGPVEGDDRTGGLIGYTDTGQVSISFWDTETSDQTQSDGGMGRTTAQMIEQITFGFEGWDFDLDWQINDGVSYPTLLWQTDPEGLPLGELLVTIEPEAAREAGAQWRRQGAGIWHDSGAKEWDVPAGLRRVEFKAIDGWETPSPEGLFIDANQTNALTITYTARAEDPDSPPPAGCFGDPIETNSAVAPSGDLLAFFIAIIVMAYVAIHKKTHSINKE